jgi:hypothetical protein
MWRCRCAARGQPGEGPQGQHRAGNPHELGHRVVVGLDAGQHLAEHIVREAFHRSEDEARHGGKIVPFKAWPGAQCNATSRCNKGLCAAARCRAVISAACLPRPCPPESPRHAPPDPHFQRRPNRRDLLICPAGPDPDHRRLRPGLAVRAPGAPKKIVMSTGAAGGAYHYFGERYREKLPRTASRWSCGHPPAPSKTCAG